MARELVQRSIDGRAYEFTQFNTTMSLKVLSRLTKLVGEPLAIALGGAGGKVSLDMDVSADLLGKAVRALIDRLDEAEVVGLVKLLTSEQVLCDHGKIVFDDHFCGDIGHLVRVVMAALEVQYGSFFGGVTDLISATRTVESVVPVPTATGM